MIRLYSSKEVTHTTLKICLEYIGLVETHPVLQSLVATLSTAPVGPSDKIGCSDVSLIMKSCNAEGLLLKPEWPARAIDDQIVMVSDFNILMPSSSWSLSMKLSTGKARAIYIY